MLPTPETRVWSSSSRLTPETRLRTRRTNSVVVELGVERVAGDVRDLGRQLGAAVGDHQPAEHPLVDEPQLVDPPNFRAGQRETDPQVPLVGGAGGLHEHLAAHAEVAEQGVAVVERQPEVLAAPAGGLDPAAGQGGGEAGGPARVAADRARVQHLDLGQPGADDVALQAGDGRPRPRAARAPVQASVGRWRPASAEVAASSPYAVSAACCSASFLERPTPLP